MADVFISYTRCDKDFVLRLHEALGELGRETWVDWEGIPPTAEWLEEIYTAIDAANALIFVISPESIASEVCRQEIEYAIQQHKRLLPIVYREVNTGSVPEVLARLNWIFFRSHDDFNAALQSLIEALDTDLNWVREHTRLLVRSKEWDRDQREHSFLLRGRDLEDAEAWLAQGAEKKPHPTSIQTLYITSSRSAATRRQRIALGAIAVGLVIAIVLAIIAITERGIAQRNEQIATARQLAAQSEMLRNQDDHLLERSLLLAVEAMRRLVNTDARSVEIDQVLRRGLALLPRPAHKMTREEGLRVAAFSPNGRYAATDSGTETILVRALESGNEIARLQHDKRVQSVIFSPKGDFIATKSSGGDLACVWETESGSKVSCFPIDGARAGWMALSPKGTYLAHWELDSTICRIFEVSTGKELRLLKHSGEVSFASFSPDGAYLATLDERHIAGPEYGLTLWELGSWRQIERKENAGWRLAFSPDGRYLATAPAFGSVAVWDLRELPLRQEVLRTENGATAVAFSADAKLLATASKSGWGIVRLWDIAKRKRIAELKHGSVNMESVVFSPDGELLVSTGGNSIARVWAVKKQKEVARVAYDKSIFKAVTFTSDGAYLATLSGILGAHDGHGTLQTWESTAFQEKIRSNLGGKTASYSSDGKFVLTKDAGTAQVREVPSGQQVAKLFHQGLRTHAFSPDIRHVVTAGWHTAQLWDMNSWDRIGPELRHTSSWEDKMQVVEFSPNGKQLATVTRDKTVRVWSVPGGQQLASFMHEKPVTALDYHPSSEVIATASWDSSISVWDIANNRKILELPHENAFDIRYSPNGNLLATAGGDNSVRVWRNDQEIALINLDDDILAMEFGPKGKYLAIGGKDKLTHILEVGSGKIHRIVHDRAVTAIAFQPNGDHLATMDGDTRVWRLGNDLEEVARINYDVTRFSLDGKYLLGPRGMLPWLPVDLIAEARGRLTRNLTRAEWDQYIRDEEYRPTFPDLDSR